MRSRALFLSTLAGVALGAPGQLRAEPSSLGDVQGFARAELSLNAPGGGFALGLGALLRGRYHVDVADINAVDRHAGSVQPYCRSGIGFEF